MRHKQQTIWNETDRTTLIPWYIRYLLSFRSTLSERSNQRTGIFNAGSVVVWKSLWGKFYEIKVGHVPDNKTA